MPSKETTIWMSKYIDTVIDWPPNSPDLSPIENVWGMMKEYLSSLKISTKNELRKACINFWDNILTQDKINELCRGAVSRFVQVLFNDGGSINDELRRHKLPSIENNEFPEEIKNLIEQKKQSISSKIRMKNPNIQIDESFTPQVRLFLLHLKNQEERASPTPWSNEESQKLLNFIIENGHNWRKATAYFPGRTVNQIRYKAKQLTKKRIEQISNSY